MKNWKQSLNTLKFNNIILYLPILILDSDSGKYLEFKFPYWIYLLRLFKRTFCLILLIRFTLYNVYTNIFSKYVMFESSFSQNVDHFVMHKESAKVITMANKPKLLIPAEDSRFWALEKPPADFDFFFSGGRGESLNFLIFFPVSLSSVFPVKRWLFFSSEHCTITDRHCKNVWQTCLFWICMPKSCRAEYRKPWLPLKWLARAKSSIIQLI